MAMWRIVVLSFLWKNGCCVVSSYSLVISVMAQPDTTKKKKKKWGERIRFLESYSCDRTYPFAPHHSFSNISFLSWSSLFIFSQPTHTLLSHPVHFTLPYTSFLRPGSLENFIGKGKAHSPLLFEVKISNLFVGLWLTRGFLYLSFNNNTHMIYEH